MAILKQIEKHPDETIPVTWRWHKNITGAQTITAHLVTVPVALTVESSAVVEDTNIVAYISGGVSGTTYNVECEITRSDDAVFVAEINIEVRDYS